MKKWLLLSLLWIMTLLSCAESDDMDPYEDSLCDHLTIVDKNRYESTDTKPYSIRSVELSGNSLEVELESGGCGGNTWQVDLIDAGNIAESNPEQRSLKINLKNKELCNAIVIRTFSFDLRPIRTSNEVVLLNLEKWEEQIQYEY